MVWPLYIWFVFRLSSLPFTPTKQIIGQQAVAERSLESMFSELFAARQQYATARRLTEGTAAAEDKAQHNFRSRDKDLKSLRERTLASLEAEAAAKKVVDAAERSLYAHYSHAAAAARALTPHPCCSSEAQKYYYTVKAPELAQVDFASDIAGLLHATTIGNASVTDRLMSAWRRTGARRCAKCWLNTTTSAYSRSSAWASCRASSLTSLMPLTPRPIC